MKRIIKTCLAIITLLVSLSASAEYIRDDLPLDMYTLPDGSGAVIKTLSSGEDIKVIDTQGEFSKVRAEDKTEGWVRSEFVTQAAPVKSKLKQVTSQRDQLQLQLNNIGVTKKTVKDLQRQLRRANKTIESLEDKLQTQQANTQQDVQSDDPQQVEIASLQEKLEQLIDNVSTLELEKQELEEQLEAGNGHSNSSAISRIAWLLFAMLLSLMLGGLLGTQWLANRIRKRFNGLKVW